MKKKYHIYLSYEERQEIVHALNDMRNTLIHTGHYTDVIDEILIKVMSAKISKQRRLQRIQEQSGDMQELSEQTSMHRFEGLCKDGNQTHLA